MRTVEQLEDNLGAATWELSPGRPLRCAQSMAAARAGARADEVERLDDASDPGRPDYPYGFIDEFTRPRREALQPGAAVA